MSADDKVNMTLDEIIRMERKHFKKGPGSVHSVATERSSFSRISQRSKATQRSWGPQNNGVPYRSRSSSRGRRSRSRTSFRSEQIISRFAQQNRRNGSSVAMQAPRQRKKMVHRYFTPSGVRHQMLSKYPKQSNGSYIVPHHFQGFLRKDHRYNQSSMWARVQYAKNRVRLAKKTLNRSQMIYIRQLKELQKQFIVNTENYNSSAQFRFRNGYQKETNDVNLESSPAPKQSLTVCIKNELAMRNWSRAQGGKILPNKSNAGYLNKGNLKLSSGKMFQSPASLQKTIVYKNRMKSPIPYVNENEPEICPGIAPWDTLMISVPSVTSSSLNERFTNK